MSASETSHAARKALEINLDPSIFGSFAEIGAGQEVARWFFRVGAASGTVAKTISAYDKAVSDDLYGAGTRYVSRERLESMLDAEWTKVVEQIGAERCRSTRLFAFADTAAARNYAGTNICHAWVGLRFQQSPCGEPSTIVLHLNLREDSAQLQAESLGRLGVNLVHGAYHAAADHRGLLLALFEGIDLEQVEIDVAEVRGPVAEGWDDDRIQADLVHLGLARAVLRPVDGSLAAPAEAFYKRPLVFAPGRFQRVDDVHRRALEAALEALSSEVGADGREAMGAFALTLDGTEDAASSVERIAALHALGRDVLLTSMQRLYRITAFAERYTSAQVRFAVSIGVLARVLRDRHNEVLDGRMLEALARLFQHNVRMYVFATSIEALDEDLRDLLAEDVDRSPGALVEATDLRPVPPVHHLYDYLLEAGFIVPLGTVEAVGA